MFRMVWALFYWNSRKSFYVLRGRRSRCPCHNPSDSGKAMETACEGVMQWSRPERFQKVCPLLVQNEKKQWVCSVSAAEVRPFWGRVLAFTGATTGLCLFLAVGVAYGGLKSIGYRVSLRQIVWPPAWSELQEVRAELFVRQSREHYAAGEVREAIQSLTVAHSLNPEHYEMGMLLAKFLQASSPSQADRLYQSLLGTHPDRQTEITRVWFQSLLARGLMREVAELARQQLSVEGTHLGAWTNAVLFATQYLEDDSILEDIRLTESVPVDVREMVDLTIRARGRSNEDAARLLLKTPMEKGFAFEKVHRVETLIRLGYPQEALALLNIVSGEMTGRDVARLILLSYAAMGDQARLQREFSVLLAPDRKISPAVIKLLAVHLVDYPDRELLGILGDALGRMPLDANESRLEALIAVFCAAGVQADEVQMEYAQRLITHTLPSVPLALVKMQEFFLSESPDARIVRLLPSLNPITLELNYALLRRYLPKPDRLAEKDD